MSMTDYDDEEEENEEEEKEKPSKSSRTASATMDPDEFADALVSKLEAKSGKMSASQRDYISETIAALKADGYSDDYLAATARILKDQEKGLTEKLDQRLSQIEQKRQNERVIERGSAYINAELRRSFSDNPELKEFNDEVRAGIDALLRKDQKFWDKIGRGQLDEDTISKAIEKTTDKFLKLTGGEKKKSVNPAINPAKSGRKGASVKEQDDDEEVDEDLLDDHQLTAYFAFEASNRKRFGMSDEEAKKDAFKTARKLPRIRAEKSVL